MKTGTKSILFGVHAFWWHPITVLFAWRKIYKTWPRWQELVAIVLHDIGYWGLPNIDGREGKMHPYRGAGWTASLVSGFPRFPVTNNRRFNYYFWFTAAHSRDAAAALSTDVSPLYAADKVSVLFDPTWFYLLRARLSGEIHEYKANAGMSGVCDSAWFDYYCKVIRTRPGIVELLD